MKVAIIGSGMVGKAIGGRAVKSGHSVTFSSAHPDKAREAAESVGAKAADTNAAAVRDADLVVLAIPNGAVAGVLRDLGPDLDGKPVIDTTNRMNRENPAAVLDGTSITEQAQQAAPNARLVKAFNTLFASVMAEAVVDGEPAHLFLAGDDPEAKAQVAEFGRSLGFRPIDFGPAAMARVLEGMALGNMLMNISHGWPWRSAFKIAGPTGQGQ